MPNYNVLVSTGYVEDADNGWLWFNYITNEERTNKEIFEDLKQVFLAAAREKNNKLRMPEHKCPPPPEMPFSNGSERPPMAYCPYCGWGFATEKDNELLEEELRVEASGLMRDLAHHPTEEADEDLISMMRVAGFEIWGRPITGRMVMISAVDRGFEEYQGFPEITSYRVTVEQSEI